VGVDGFYRGAHGELSNPPCFVVLVHYRCRVIHFKWALVAENLFLRRQLAVYLERKVKPYRASDGTRLILVLLSRMFAWRQALTIVKPDTLIRWHRRGFRLLWKWKSKPRGRPRVPIDLRKLIGEMANENPPGARSVLPLKCC